MITFYTVKGGGEAVYGADDSAAGGRSSGPERDGHWNGVDFTLNAPG